ncbi:MAG: VWA domain-containing protein [Prevotellaceae bacterium]|jgi:Ca-activated chloride channel family protein|nr:VWA domain-containing protein [Prevotellaceae bacterium]
MIQIAQFEYVWLLLLIPALVVGYALFVRSKRKALARFGDMQLMQPLMPLVSKRRGWLKIILLCLAIFFFTLGLMRPQIGATVREMKSRGVEVIIALDVSNSMLAEDFRPNRLERAKLAISRLVDRLKDDRIGLIVFAGDAYVQLPVTTDYVSAKIFLSSISPDIVPKQGTAIGQAIALATRSYTLQSDKSRALIIITDGENHEDDAMAAAKAAVENGIVIHTIGIGSVGGQPIPTKNGMLKDKDGNIVVTKLNEAVLQEIAAAGNGSYTHATNADLGLDKVVDSINSMEKQELKAIVFEDFNEQFMYMLVFTLFFLLVEMFIVERKNRWSKSFDIFKKTFLFILLWSLSFPTWAQDDKKEVREGIKKYKDEQYNDAEIAFRRGLKKDSLSYAARFNLGDALYKQEQFEQAEALFKSLATDGRQAETDRAKLMHNLGNAQLQQKKYKESIDAYKQALRLSPTDDETRSNLAYAQRMLQNEAQPQPQPQNQDKNDQQQQQNQDQQQNQNQDNQQDNQNQQNEKNDRQQQPQEPKISPQQAQQILDAVQSNEKETQEKVKKEKAKALGKYKTEKNW